MRKVKLILLSLVFASFYSCEDVSDAETQGGPATDIRIETEITANIDGFPEYRFYGDPARSNAANPRFEPRLITARDGEDLEEPVLEVIRNPVFIEDLTVELTPPRLDLPNGERLLSPELYLVIRDASEGVTRRIWDFFEGGAFDRGPVPTGTFNFFNEDFEPIENLEEYDEPVLLLRPIDGQERVIQARLFAFFEDGTFREHPFRLDSSTN